MVLGISNFETREAIKDMFQAIAAKGPKGYPCCAWLGPGAAGHFVKMVHNGIEYADMQMISEIFHVAKDGLRQDISTISSLFQKWTYFEDLSSYLIEITANILAFKENEAETSPLISRIRDTAGQVVPPIFPLLERNRKVDRRGSFDHGCPWNSFR